MNVKYIYAPLEIQVYNKTFKTNMNDYNQLNNLQVVNEVNKLTEDKLSFLVDITPYIAFLHSSFNNSKYVIEAIKFINSFAKRVAYPNVIVLYNVEDNKINNLVDKVTNVIDIEKLYGSLFAKVFRNNDTKFINNLFITQILIYYHNNFGNLFTADKVVDYNQYKQFIHNLINANILFTDEKELQIQQKIEELKRQKEEQQNNNIQSTTQTSLSTPEPTMKIEEIKDDDLNYNNKSYNDLLSSLKIDNNDSASSNWIDKISQSVITKIDDEQFNKERAIPVVDKNNQENFNKIVNQNNIKTMPFLTTTKVKNNNITDVNHKFLQNDNEGRLISMLNELIPQITNDKQQEKKVYDLLYSKFIKNPELLNKAFEAFDKGDFHQFFSYYNEYQIPYESRIYPKKDEPDKEVIKELDNWSHENQLDKMVSTDPLLTGDIMTSIIPNNLHRVIAQKQLTWNRMPQEVESYITKLLDDNGFQLMSVDMIDVKPPITQIEPTYKSVIRIKIRNRLTKAGQTLTFDVPTLIEGKYHISGGLKWLFPNVIATLPIFVINPGKVQFRTAYTSITYNHHSSNNKETVTAYVGGINMLLLTWLLQFKSFKEIGDYLGFTVELFDSRKLAANCNIIAPLPDKSKFIGINITNTNNARLIKGICNDLITLINRLAKLRQPFDLYSKDDGAEYIQLFSKKRKNLEYMFEKIKRYTIDKRTEGILQARGIEPNMFEVAIRCATICITDATEERLSINNINLRLMDLIPSQIEKALHYALSEYNRRKLTDPDAKLVVSSGWVINKLREESVLQLYNDGNLTIENAQLTGVRIVGPGGFGNVDMVQTKDRNIVGDHFGVLDPVDTAEGNPGVQMQLTTGFEYDPKNKIFSQVRSNNSYKSMVGSGAAQIPFISFNDGNRIQFGGSQGRQVVPVQGSEVPLIGTGMEAALPQYSSEKFTKKSPVDGTVAYVDDKIIIVKGDDGRAHSINITPSNLQTGAGKYSGLEHTATVQVGQRVNKFDYLATNQFIKPTYSAGCNVLACYKPQMGYTYDDGIVISESFAQKYTSLHYQNIDVYVNYVNELIEFPLFKFKKEGNMSYQTGETIIKIRQTAFGGFSENEVNAPTNCKVIDLQIFPANNSFNELIKEIENTFYSKTNQALRNFKLEPMMNSQEYINAAGNYEFRKNKLDRTLIRIKLMEYRSCGLGDKLTNRHGAKGVIAQIFPDDKMPRLADGRIMDICLNSLGVISRMNMGQVMEMHVGNVLHTAQDWLKKNAADTTKCVDMLCELYTLLDGFKDKRLSQKMISQFRAYPINKQKELVDYYIKNGIRIIVPPFENPKLEDVNAAAKLVGAELESKLFLPEFNRWTMQPVTWGYLYVLKLQHISSIKQNVRSVGPYIQTTMMPSKPGHHRNAIRVGEQDSWAFSCYKGGKEILRELFLVNADNPRIKNDIIRSIETTGSGDIDESQYPDMTSGAAGAFKIYSTIAGLAIN